MIHDPCHQASNCDDTAAVSPLTRLLARLGHHHHYHCSGGVACGKFVTGANIFCIKV